MEIYFVFFFPTLKKKKELKIMNEVNKPHPHCSTFASPTACPDPSGSQRSNQRLAKELQPTETVYGSTKSTELTSTDENKIIGRVILLTHPC